MKQCVLYKNLQEKIRKYPRCALWIPFVLAIFPIIAFIIKFILTVIENWELCIAQGVGFALEDNLGCLSKCVGLFSILSTLFLCYGCAQYHMGWLRNEVEFRQLRSAYNLMIIVRILTYVISGFALLLAFKGEPYINNESLMRSFTICAVALFQSSLQSVWQTTFRRRSSYSIAVANAILYLALLDTACNSTPYILGWIQWSEEASLREALVTKLEPIFALASGGLIVTVVVAFLQSILSSLLSAMTSHNPSNQMQQRRRNRRRILTHWNYRQDGAASSHEDTCVRVLLVEMVVAAFALALALWKSPLNEVTDTSSSYKLVPIFAVYLVVIAAIILVLATMSLWSISDEKLIQSEYSYLTIRSIYLKEEDIRCSHTRWLDFCQVLVHLSSNVSGLDSEDGGYHNIHKNIFQLYDCMSKEGKCVKVKFLVDILRIKGNATAALLRESAHENAKNEDDTDSKKFGKKNHLRQAQDIQFAGMLTGLLDEYLKSVDEASDFIEGDPFIFVLRLDQFFFSANTSDASENNRWAQHLSSFDIDTSDGIRMLRTDGMIRILHRDTQSSCGISWLGCNCEDKSPNCTDYVTKLSRINRMILMLQYPFMILRCYAERWESVRSIFFYEEIINYYKQLMEQNMSCNSKEELCKVIYGAYVNLLEMDADITILPYVVHGFDALLTDTSTTNPVKDKIRAGKTSNIVSTLNLDQQFKYLEVFGNGSTETASLNALATVASILFSIKEGGNEHES